MTDDAFRIRIMIKKFKACSRDTESEYLVNSLRLKCCTEKGTMCVTFKLLSFQNEYEKGYYIPPKSKAIKVPLIIVS